MTTGPTASEGEPMDEMKPTEGRRRRGQTLAEFAITLPVLLLLLFGIVEFGRIFQAWVTLQNSARAAARYATTGQWDSDRFVMDVETLADDPDSLVPCVEADERGTVVPYDVTGRTVQIYIGGTESLYATWYQGEDCDPKVAAHQERREDLARILSIFDEARIGAAGLALAAPGTNLSPATWGDPPQTAAFWTSNNNPANLAFLNQVPWYDIWRRPLPGDPDGPGAAPALYYHHTGFDTRGYFDVMICSDRGPTNQASGVDTIPPSGRAYTSADSDIDTFLGQRRFITVIDASTSPIGGDAPFMAPVCMLNERQTGAGTVDNAGLPWLDPGGPGDPITIVVTFNHPLITPLGLSPYLQLQARRTAVNEAFRASRSITAGTIIIPSVGGPDGTPEVTPEATDPPEMTPSVTPTPTATSTATATASQTPTFTCDQIVITEFNGAPNFGMSGNQFFVEWENRNPQESALLRVVQHWDDIPAYAGMYPSTMRLASAPFWSNSTNSTNDPIDTAIDSQWVPGAMPRLQPYVPTRYDVSFVNGPAQIDAFLTLYAFNETTFYFDNPDSDTDCEKILSFSPDEPPTPGGASPTPTPTPDCVPGLMRIRFAEFQSRGIVRVEVTNFRNVPSVMVGFNIGWRQYDASGGLRLDEVLVGGSSPSPGEAVPIWRASSGQDNTPPTVGRNGNPPGSEGTWLTNFNFPPQTTTNLWLDYEGVVGRLTEDFASQGPLLADFNNSSFSFLVPDCEDGAGGPGGVVTEDATPDPNFTPTSSNTPAPTNTPRPTNTQGPSSTPRPTNTRAPSATPGPTNTPRPTNTVTATATWTPIGMGGVGSGG